MVNHKGVYKERLLQRVVDGTDKQRRLILRLDDKEEWAVQREVILLHRDRHTHPHDVHLGVGSSFAAVLIHLDVALL